MRVSPILPILLLAGTFSAAAPHPAALADAITDIVAALPGEVRALTRIPGPQGEDTSFVVVREDAGDRLFVQTGGAGTPPVEVTDLGAPLPGRVTDLRSERDTLGIAVFVDLRGGDGTDTTYELFWEGEDAASYVFQPASN
ncbi:hypothetical protein [Stappia sp.]|uniref:hypothetical protein n=1 Tax=Stappia sp. TaxID=1870903 RepID=UPI0032D8C403